MEEGGNIVCQFGSLSFAAHWHFLLFNVCHCFNQWECQQFRVWKCTSCPAVDRVHRIQRKDWTDLIWILTIGLHWCTDIGLGKWTGKIFTPCCSRCVLFFQLPRHQNTINTSLCNSLEAMFWFWFLIYCHFWNEKCDFKEGKKKQRTNQAECVCTLTSVSVACDHCPTTVHFLVSSTVLYTVQWLLMACSVLLINKYLLLVLCNPINYVFENILILWKNVVFCFLNTIISVHKLEHLPMLFVAVL